MKCAICKHGETHPGTATVTLERDNVTLIFKDVPAQVCANCGEEYIEAPVTRQLLTSAEEAEKAGVELTCGTTKPPDNDSRNTLFAVRHPGSANSAQSHIDVQTKHATFNHPSQS